MSKVKIQGNASGTGTLTISAPNTNVDRSLTLPDGAGEILLANGNGSSLTNMAGSISFFADGQNTQGITANTLTKITNLTDVWFNNGSAWASNRYTPGVSGVSYLTCSVRYNTTTDFNDWGVRLYKNGSMMTLYQTSHWHNESSIMSAVVNHNTTDYFEFYVWATSSAQIYGSQMTFASGFLITET